MALTKVDDRGLKTPIDLQDNEKIRLGTGNDLELYHDGNQSRIVNNTNNFFIQTDAFRLRSGDSSELLVAADKDSGVDLYFNNSKKFETTSAGISVTGTSTFGGSLIMGADNSYDIGSGAARVRNMFMYQTLDFLDTGKIQMGNSDDLQIYHDGSNSAIQNATGTLFLYGGSNNIRIRPENGEDSIVATPNGAVELYYDNSKKFETTSEGGTLTGRLTISDTSPIINFTDTNNDSDFRIQVESGSFIIEDATNSYADRVLIDSNGAVTIGGNLDVSNVTTHDVVPDSNAFRNLGTSSTKWNQIHATTLYGDGSNLTGLFVTGMIMIWSGASNAIPTGWLICDGTNSTPDLRDRFVIGAGNNYAVGATGGSADATLVSHSHTTNSTINPSDTNTKDLSGAVTKISEGFRSNGTATGVFTKTDDGNSSITGSSSNSPVSGFTMDVNHRHGTDSQGSSATNANLPPYYALCYIMKS